MLRNLVVKLTAALAGVTLATAMTSAHAATPIRMIIGYAPGGGADALARIVADGLSKELQTPVIVEGRPGAGGALAAGYVASVPADGLTLFLANSNTMVTKTLTSKSLPYDAVKDFKPVGQISAGPLGIVAASGAYASLKDWISAARANPKSSMFAVPASASAPEFIGFHLGTEAKVKLSSVPYKGAAPMIVDMLGQQVSVGITAIPDLVKYHQDGRLKVLAVTGAGRSPTLPDVPTLKELGYSGFERTEWVGIFIKSATPADKTAQIRSALAKVMANPQTTEKFATTGYVATYASPDEMGKTLSADLAYWGPIIKASGFTPE